MYDLEHFGRYIATSLAPATVKDYVLKVKYFKNYLNEYKQIDDLVAATKIDIIDYVAYLKNKGMINGSVRSYAVSLKKYYAYLVRYKVITREYYLDLFEDLELPKLTRRRQKVYYKDDAKKIIKVFENDCFNTAEFGCFIFLLIAATTAARRKEIAMLKVGDIDVKRECVTYYCTKNREPRTIQLCEYVLEQIKLYIEKRNAEVVDHDTLFINRYGQAMNVNSLDTMMRRKGKRHGITISFHAFRRGLASELYRRGVTVKEIADILGHVSIDMTDKYIYKDTNNAAVLKYAYADDDTDTAIDNTACQQVVNNVNNSIDVNILLQTISNLNTQLAMMTQAAKKSPLPS